TRFSRDWSSDVCSSDLSAPPRRSANYLTGASPMYETDKYCRSDSCDRCGRVGQSYENLRPSSTLQFVLDTSRRAAVPLCPNQVEIGRASCRESVVEWRA